MSATLPPGWTGNDALHHTEVGFIRATVVRVSSRIAGDGRRRLGGYRYLLDTTSGVGIRASEEPHFAHAPEARRAALTALQTLLTTAVADVGAALANLNDTEPA